MIHSRIPLFALPLAPKHVNEKQPSRDRNIRLVEEL